MNKNLKAAKDVLGELGMRCPQVLTKTYTSNIIDIYIDGEIDSPEQYREAYHAFSNAGPQDTIMLHINSIGGRLDSGVQLIQHIKNCDAQVIGVLHMECASMASGIFLACDDWVINEFSTLMIHSCSYGAIGKQSDILSRVEFNTKFNERFIRKIYTGFLSEEEIKRVLDGSDLYFDAEEIDDRLTKFSKYRDKFEEVEVEPEVEVKVTKPKPAPRKKPAATATV